MIETKKKMLLYIVAVGESVLFSKQHICVGMYKYDMDTKSNTL